jgi:hypothetical protein
MKRTRALALFSGGLDSILAARVVAAQGIEVLAVKFVTPFFGYEILANVAGYTKSMREKYGIEVLVEDISAGYLELLHQPRHGFGKNFNPCVDCKIFMLNRAREMMAELGASFLVTGEVLGQRPMSQRLDTLHVIGRDSGSRSFLLRPLSAKLLPETMPERQGLVDRERLLNFGGRGRARQIALAKEMGITDFPSPAGGCILADPILSRRIARLYGDQFVLKPADITVADVRLLLVGRQFILPGGGWLILGRIEEENNRIAELAGPDDALLFMEERPGPTALIRHAMGCYSDISARDGDLQLAAGLVVRYGRKEKGVALPGEVVVTSADGRQTITAGPVDDGRSVGWML